MLDKYENLRKPLLRFTSQFCIIKILFNPNGKQSGITRMQRRPSPFCQFKVLAYAAKDGGKLSGGSK